MQLKLYDTIVIPTTQTKHINSSTFPGFHSLFKAKHVNSRFQHFFRILLSFQGKDKIPELFQTDTKIVAFFKPLRTLPHVARCRCQQSQQADYLILSQTGKLVLAHLPIDVSENLDGRVENRTGGVEFCIGYIRDYPVRASTKKF